MSITSTGLLLGTRFSVLSPSTTLNLFHLLRQPMKLQICTVIFLKSFILASAQSIISGSTSYTAITPVSRGGPTPTIVFEAPALLTEVTPAVSPNMASYQLNSSFEITNRSVTRTYYWTIA